MTDQEWRECTDPTPMLSYLHGKASDRKLRLFIANYCRRTWHLFQDERCRKAIEVAERFADGQVGDEELSQVYIEISRIWSETFHVAEGDEWQSARVTPASFIADSCRRAVRPSGRFTPRIVDMAAENLARVVAEGTAGESERAVWEAERWVQVDFLHEIFCDPFRPITINPAWLTWNDGTVHRIARSIYDERAFDRMPILADALEDAGCNNADILIHCRGLGLHGRGCWVVDLLLRKE